MRAIPDICQHLLKLDQYVEKVFIPAVIDGHIPNNFKRKLLSLPVKLGGIGIVIFADSAKTEYQNSRNTTESLTKLHLQQTTEYNISRDKLAKLKYNIKKVNCNVIQSTSMFDNRLSTNKIRLNKINQEKGASTWLSTLPLKEEGYSLSKQEFWDLLKIRCGWPLSRSLRSEIRSSAQFILRKGWFCYIKT